MKIDSKLVDKLAKLSKLEFNEEQNIAVQEDLKKITAFFEKIVELDTDQIEPLIYMNEEVNNMRYDEVVKLNSKADGLKNAPSQDGDYIRVPKMIDK